MSKNENVVEKEVSKVVEEAADVYAEGAHATEVSKEPTREQIIAAYHELSNKYDKLFRAYADLFDLYLGNKPANR